MSPTPFRVIPNAGVEAEHRAAGEPMPERVAERVRRLQAEARQLGRDHMRDFMAQHAHVLAMAREIAEGGDAYSAGFRDLCGRMADKGEADLQTLEAIMAKSA